MKSRRSESAGISALSSDDLLKIFSLLPPCSLARCCLVCTSCYWRVGFLHIVDSMRPSADDTYGQAYTCVHTHKNKIIINSLFWKKIYNESRRYLLEHHSTTKKINIFNGEILGPTDWKAQYVKEQHKVLFVLGSVFVKEWKGHSKRVECCRFRMETIMTGSSDGVVRAWSTSTSKCLVTYVVPNRSRVVDLEFDESKILAVAGTEIYIWNRKKGCLLRHIRGHGQSIHSMCYADPDVLIGCSDGTVRVFDIYSGRCAQIFRQHADRVTCIVVDIVASLLMSGSADGTVQLCDYTTGQKLCCLLPSSPPTEVLCLHLLQQQSKLVGGTSRGHVYAWDIRKHKLLWSVRTGPNSVTSLHAQFYDPSTLVIGSINGVISILDTGSGVILRLFAVVQNAAQADSLGVDETKVNMAVAERMGANMDSSLEEVPSKSRPPILCLRTGMRKIVTTHPDGTIRVWRFEL